MNDMDLTVDIHTPSTQPCFVVQHTTLDVDSIAVLGYKFLRVCNSSGRKCKINGISNKTYLNKAIIEKCRENIKNRKEVLKNHEEEK